MWSLRRASTTNTCLRAQRLRPRAARAGGVLSAAKSCVEEQWSGNSQETECRPIVCSSCYRFCHTTQHPCQFSVCSRNLSSQAGASSGGEEDDDLVDGFSELDEPETSETLQGSDDEDVLEEGFSELEGPDTSGTLQGIRVSDENESESGSELTLSVGRSFSSALFKAIMDDKSQHVYKVLDKYIEDGNELSHSEVSNAMLILRRQKMYAKALKLSEWLETSKHIDFLEQDYASRVDLIGKVRGLWKAESYIESIPEPFRGELVYRTLLANFTTANNVKKTEEVFNKMKVLGLPITASACNELLLLYKRMDQKKIADVLLLMEEENIKLMPFTYNILIDAKGRFNDIYGMDRIVKKMKAEGMYPNLRTQTILAKHYAARGFKEKAEAVLKAIKGRHLKPKRGVCRLLLPIYAELGNASEVGRVWDVCKEKPDKKECLAAIEAWGKLKKIEEAEAVFEQMTQTWNRLSSRHYTALIKVYAKHKMLSKGVDLARRMGESGCYIGPLTWDALVKLYIEAGEVEKADAILLKAVQKKRGKPIFSSLISIMEQYARRGDIRNTEKMFHKLRKFGYVSGLRPYQTLLQAYLIAKAPAYGFKERMKADNMLPNKVIAEQLAMVDTFREKAVSDLLD